MFARATTLALSGLLILSSAASAQYRRAERPVATVGVDFLVGEPVGEFSDFVDAGFGAEFMGRLPMEANGFLSLRGDLGFLIYGHESKRVCIAGVGCRVEARLQTTNAIFYGGLGPELALPLPFARPYVNATMGFAYFSTSSSLENTWGGEDYFNTQNMGDGSFSWGVGWGVEFNLHRGRVPVALNLGGRYHENGVVEYLTEGDIIDHPDGSITLYPIMSEANLITYRIGVTVGIPRKSRDDDGNKGRGKWHW